VTGAERHWWHGFAVHGILALRRLGCAQSSGDFASAINLDCGFPVFLRRGSGPQIPSAKFKPDSSCLVARDELSARPSGVHKFRLVADRCGDLSNVEDAI